MRPTLHQGREERRVRQADWRPFGSQRAGLAQPALAAASSALPASDLGARSPPRCLVANQQHHSDGDDKQQDEERGRHLGRHPQKLSGQSGQAPGGAGNRAKEREN